jgi:hypothetical protein
MLALGQFPDSRRRERTRPARDPVSCNRGRNLRAGARGTSFALLQFKFAPSAIRAGGLSPMGEPLAILPPTVAAFLTCQPPKRRTSSPRSGSMAASAVAASSTLTVAPMRKESPPDPRSSSRPGDASEPNDLRQVAQFLGDPQADVGRAGNERRVRDAFRKASPDLRRSRARQRSAGPCRRKYPGRRRSVSAAPRLLSRRA